MAQQENQKERSSLKERGVRFVLTSFLLAGGFNDTVQLPENIGKLLKKINVGIERVHKATQDWESAPHSYDQEKLGEARAAMFELQNCFSYTINELKQLKEKCPSGDGSMTSNTEKMANEQVEINKYIAQLEGELENLQVAQKRIEASRQASDWLNPETKEEALKALAKEAGNFALAENSELKNFDMATDSPERQQFHYKIRQYLFLTYHCLVRCKPNLLDKALERKTIPLEPLPLSAYITAFSFIRDRKVPNAMRSEPATELIAYLNYLIEELPTRMIVS
jgi:hypothetical protein